MRTIANPRWRDDGGRRVHLDTWLALPLSILTEAVITVPCASKEMWTVVEVVTKEHRAKSATV